MEVRSVGARIGVNLFLNAVSFGAGAGQLMAGTSLARSVPLSNAAWPLLRW